MVTKWVPVHPSPALHTFTIGKPLKIPDLLNLGYLPTYKGE
jgi:hypothetical protein